MKTKIPLITFSLVIYLGMNTFSSVSLKAQPPAAAPRNNNLKEIRTEEKQNRGDKLKEWLKVRHSPLSASTSALMKTKRPDIIIAISNAESNLGTNFVDSYGRKTKHRSYNLWGIKPNSRTGYRHESWNIYLAKYHSQEEAIKDIDWLLRNCYYPYGMTTPKKIARKWVGWKSPNWIYNVSSVQNDVLKIIK